MRVIINSDIIIVEGIDGYVVMRVIINSDIIIVEGIDG